MNEQDLNIKSSLSHHAFVIGSFCAILSRTKIIVKNKLFASIPVRIGIITKYL